MDYTHLTEEERYQIDDLRREGLSKRKIAKRLGQSASTVSRELARNTGERGWQPRQAQLKAIERLVVRGTNNASKVSDAAWQYAFPSYLKISAQCVKSVSNSRRINKPR